MYCNYDDHGWRWAEIWQDERSRCVALTIVRTLEFMTCEYDVRFPQDLIGKGLPVATAMTSSSCYIQAHRLSLTCQPRTGQDRRRFYIMMCVCVQYVCVYDVCQCLVSLSGVWDSLRSPYRKRLWAAEDSSSHIQFETLTCQHRTGHGKIDYRDHGGHGALITPQSQGPWPERDSVGQVTETCLSFRSASAVTVDHATADRAGSPMVRPESHPLHTLDNSTAPLPQAHSPLTINSVRACIHVYVQYVHGLRIFKRSVVPICVFHIRVVLNNEPCELLNTWTTVCIIDDVDVSSLHAAVCHWHGCYERCHRDILYFPNCGIDIAGWIHLEAMQDTVNI